MHDHRWRLLALALALAGCAGRIWVDQSSPQGIRIHWYTQESTIDIAHGMAVEHCQEHGKGAVLLRLFEDHDVTVADFACR